MIKKFSVTGQFLIECIGMLIYFWRMSHDPGHVYWNMYGWTVFYDSCLMIPLASLCFIFAFMQERERCFHDKQFLIVQGIFTAILNSTVIAQNYNLIQHTYGYQIAIFGIIVTTIMIIHTSIRHGYNL